MLWPSHVPKPFGSLVNHLEGMILRLKNEKVSSLLGQHLLPRIHSACLE